MATFPLRYGSAFKAMAIPLGMGRGYAEVEDGALRVRMGPYFALEVPLTGIAAARALDDEHVVRTVLGGIGVHTDLRGTWRVNGALSPLVRIEFAESVAARALGMPVKVRALVVNPADRETFLLAIGHPAG